MTSPADASKDEARSPHAGATAADLVGMVVAERYELTSELGQGGQSVVFRARDLRGERDVAVKMLVMGGAQSREYAARLAREQEALTALAGTSAVAVYDLCRAPNRCLCLVMELLEGSDLETVLADAEAKGERLDIKRVAQILSPIVDTLERAHDAGILHRDVKPANIYVLSNDAGVRLLDFGLSRMRTATPLTQAGTILGSPSYIAPEVWKGQTGELDHRVDVYSMGVILFRALAGRLPFQSESLHGSFVLATTAPRPSLRALRPDLPPTVDAWVAKALAVSPEARHDSMRALWGGLLDALSYTPPERPFRPVADSLAAAWRTATGAFRRFMDRESESPPPPPVSRGRRPPPLPSATSTGPGGVTELPDADLHSILIEGPPKPESQTPPSTGEWMDVTEDELRAAEARRSEYPRAPSSPPRERTPTAGSGSGGTPKPAGRKARGVAVPASVPLPAPRRGGKAGAGKKAAKAPSIAKDASRDATEGATKQAARPKKRGSKKTGRGERKTRAKRR